MRRGSVTQASYREDLHPPFHPLWAYSRGADGTMRAEREIGDITPEDDEPSASPAHIEDVRAAFAEMMRTALDLMLEERYAAPGFALDVQKIRHAVAELRQRYRIRIDEYIRAKLEQFPIATVREEVEELVKTFKALQINAIDLPEDSLIGPEESSQ